MHCKNLLVNDCRDRQAVETIGEGFPQLDIIPSLTLIVKSIDTVDGSTFMISP